MSKLTEAIEQDELRKVLTQHAYAYFKDGESVSSVIEKLNYLNDNADFPLEKEEIEEIVKEKSHKGSSSKETPETKEIQTVSYEDENTLYEEIYNPESSEPFKFARLEKKTGDVSYVPNFETNGKFYLPDQSGYITGKSILLPSDIVDCSDKSLEQAKKDYINHFYFVNEKSFFFADLYTNYTWVYDRYSTCPYLRISGEAGSGKTRYLRTVGLICQRPHIVSGNVSEAVIFRTLNYYRPTLVVNEFDQLNSDDKSLMTIILNNGYEKGSPVPRMVGEGKNMRPQVFEVFGPKIMATIEKFKSTALETRIINLDPTELPRERRNEYSPVAQEDEMQSYALQIRNMLLGYRFRWIASHYASHLRVTFSINQIVARKNNESFRLSGRDDATIVRASELLFPERAGKEKIFNAFLEEDKFTNRTRQTFYSLLYILPDELIADFIRYAGEYQAEILQKMKEDLIGVVANCIVELYYNNKNITFKELKVAVTEDLGEKEVKGPTISACLRRLKIETDETGHANIKFLVLTDAKVKKLQEKYAPESPVETPKDSSTPLSQNSNSHDSQNEEISRQDVTKDLQEPKNSSSLVTRTLSLDLENSNSQSESHEGGDIDES